MELSGTSYSQAINILSGKLLRPAGDAGSLYLKVPRGYTCGLAQVTPDLYELPLVGTGQPLDWTVQFTLAL